MIGKTRYTLSDGNDFVNKIAMKTLAKVMPLKNAVIWQIRQNKFENKDLPNSDKKCWKYLITWETFLMDQQVKNLLQKEKASATPGQMLSILAISLAQLKAGNNSEKLKNEIRQILYSLYRSKKLTKNVYNNLINAI